MMLSESTLPSGARLTIREASSKADFDHARRLMWGFYDWCMERYKDLPGSADAYFQGPEFESELSALEKIYAAPEGSVLLAELDGRIVGTVALKTIGTGISEMKRFFIDPACQGGGVGMRLAIALLDLARTRGFSTMRLETGELQHEAAALYRKLGFTDIETYSGVPPALAAHLLSMEIKL